MSLGFFFKTAHFFGNFWLSDVLLNERFQPKVLLHSQSSKSCLVHAVSLTVSPSFTGPRTVK